MCGIVGWVDHHSNISSRVKVLEEMTKTLDTRGPDDYGYYVDDHVLFGHRRLVIVDPEGGKQPMTKHVSENRYIIVYNGELYNTEDVRKKLLDKGYKFKSYSDTEVLLTAYIEWGEECLHQINGIFAFGIWDEKKQSLFMARDPLGVKPLFYARRNNSVLFASELKALLAHPIVDAVVDREGLLDIFGLGPARSLGSGVFKGVNEVPPAHYLIFSRDRFQLNEYWKLKAEVHEHDFDTTVEHVRNLLIDAIERQLVSDVPVCTFLSGGLDSSAISAITANAFKKQGKGILNTFSIDYQDNDRYFQASEFQPTGDGVWAKKMAEFIGSNHHNIIIGQKQLVDALEDAVKANDLPGMADIDSSLYLFCREVRKKATVALSGECADELFGGYPWYHRIEDIQANTFPWSRSVKERTVILSEDLKNLPIEEYVAQKYQDTLSSVPKLPGETAEEARMRELFYLNIKWFMITLLNRKDRMSMANSLEVRVPFADYRIVEYAFNIPNTMKFHNGREKGLLREALKDILPHEIIKRKKSPYPKTHHVEYTRAVQEKMRKVLQNKHSPILQLIDRYQVSEIVESGGSSYKKPWFGQLMTGPQLIAFLIQINTWLKKYDVRIEL